MSAQSGYEVATGLALQKGETCDKHPDGGLPYGSLGKEEIHEVIRKHQGKLRSCSRATLKVLHQPQGKVTSQFLIAPNGRVASSCIVESALNDSEIETCLAYEILTWRFPEPRGEGCIVVTYPFSLTED